MKDNGGVGGGGGAQVLPVFVDRCCRLRRRPGGETGRRLFRRSFCVYFWRYLLFGGVRSGS